MDEERIVLDNLSFSKDQARCNKIFSGKRLYYEATVLKIPRHAISNASKVFDRFAPHRHENLALVTYKSFPSDDEDVVYYAFDQKNYTLEDFIQSKMKSNSMINKYDKVLSIIYQLIDIISFLQEENIACDDLNTKNIFMNEEFFTIKYCPLIKYTDITEDELVLQDGKENAEGNQKEEKVVTNLAKIMFYLLSGEPYSVDGPKFTCLEFHDYLNISRIAVDTKLDQILCQNKVPTVMDLKNSFIFWADKKLIDFIKDVDMLIREVEGPRNLFEKLPNSWIDELDDDLKPELKFSEEEYKYVDRILYDGHDLEDFVKFFSFLYQNFEMWSPKAINLLKCMPNFPVYLYTKHRNLVQIVYDGASKSNYTSSFYLFNFFERKYTFVDRLYS